MTLRKFSPTGPRRNVRRCFDAPFSIPRHTAVFASTTARVEEFLAARRLFTLRKKGMPIKELLRLLFAEQYGVKVVLPSMRAIAAWLALWEPAVRKELIEREPETLISSGDPGTLSLSARGDLVRSFASHYGQGNWRGLNFMADDTLKLAHPELAPVIRECWGAETTNPDVRGLLLQLIWLGPIPDCMDLALAAARNKDWDPGNRIVAIRALIAGGLQRHRSPTGERDDGEPGIMAH